MTKRLVEHEVRCAGGSPLLIAVTLPEGENLQWDPPVVTEKQPPVEVEYYIDGKLVATGVWPDVEPVKGKKK